MLFTGGQVHSDPGCLPVQCLQRKCLSPGGQFTGQTLKICLRVQVHRCLSDWPNCSFPLAVTGINYDGASSTDPDCGTSSEHTNYTCASSPFTKGERTLLSITDNSSSSDGRETSTSSVKISSSLSSDSSPSSQAQTERSNVSSHQGEHAQPSTGALVLPTRDRNCAPFSGSSES